MPPVSPTDTLTMPVPPAPSAPPQTPPTPQALQAAKASRTPPPSVLIVGAGLAGCALTASLVRRGWHVTLVDAGSGPAQGASALRTGLLQPLLSRDDNLASRLLRAGFLFSRQRLERVQGRPLRYEPRPSEPGPCEPGPCEPVPGEPGAAPLWQPRGVYWSPADGTDLAALMRPDWPEGYARACTQEEAQTLLGIAPRHPGLWFAGGAQVDVAAACAALLAEAAEGPGALQTRFRWTVQPARTASGTWCVRSDEGQEICADHVVLCAGAGLATLLGAGSMPGRAGLPPLQIIAGSLSYLAAGGEIDALRAPIAGAGHVLPAGPGSASCGASYVRLAPDFPVGTGLGTAPRVTAAEDASNLARWDALLAAGGALRSIGHYTGLRAMTLDRMPLAGTLVDTKQIAALAQGAIAGSVPSALCATDLRLASVGLPALPRLEGLHVLAAFGSRALALAPLLAEFLAARLCGEPEPIERDLANAVDPGRFALRALRAVQGAAARGR
jgi:tRNA 5-methylaminomethyl-2-thiouridine biosynthesis bifunctional protein